MLCRWSDVSFNLPDGTHICGGDMHHRMRRLLEDTIKETSSSQGDEVLTGTKSVVRRAASQV